MNRRQLPGYVFLVVAIVFGFLGLRTVPRNTTYLAIGIAFAVIALTQFRRARMS